MLADHPIFVVFLVAVAAPLIAQTRRGGRLPVVVFEVGPIVAQALIGAALLSLLVYPTAARALLARAEDGAVATAATSSRA